MVMSCEKERWWHQLKSSSCSHTSNQCQCKHLSQGLIHLHFSARLIAAQWFKQRQNPSPRLWNVPCRTGHMDLLRAVTRREKKWTWTKQGHNRQYMCISLVFKIPLRISTKEYYAFIYRISRLAVAQLFHCWLNWNPGQQSHMFKVT